jgi:uncharacterized spore protein YtfJ
MALDFETILAGITGELKTFARTESIVGEPMEMDGKTIIPVIKVRLGFGAGAGQDTSGEKKGHGGSGGGGGGGIVVEPAAFITIIGDEISVLSPKGSKFEKLVEAVPTIVSKIMESRGKKDESHDEAEEEPTA